MTSRGALPLIGAVLLGAPSAASAAFDEALYAQLLERHTRAVEDTAGVRVDYAALRDSADWRRLLDSLARTDPAALRSREERLALWINAYNVLAIDLVVRHGPVDGIRDIGSLWSPVWKREAGRVGGRSVTLHEIEHGILRPLGEPRIHAAIVCASTSCPSLRRAPYTAADLDAQLDAALRGFLADPRKGMRIDRERGVVWLSKIFDWFAEDFQAGGSVLETLRPYAPDAARAWLAEHPEPRVRHLDYDWSLNAIRG